MVDEMVSWRLFLLHQFQESQKCLRKLIEKFDLGHKEADNSTKEILHQAQKLTNIDTAEWYRTSPCDEFMSNLKRQAAELGFRNLTINCCRNCSGEIQLL